nr:PAS domain S-box protein [Desulfomicrobium escambiense]
MTSCFTQRISLFDLFQAEEIQRVQDAFALASNVASVISAPDGTPLTSPGNLSEPFTTLVHGRNAVEAGHVFPATALRTSAADGLAVYVCPLTDLLYAAMPIIVGERHVANWVIGQVRDEDTNGEQAIALAGRIGADPEAVAAALEQVPRMDRSRFTAVADSMALIAGHVFHQAYRTRCLCMGEGADAELALRESAARYRSVIENIQDTYYRTDAGGALIMLSPSGASLLGYETVEELLGTPMEKLWKTPEAFQKYVEILSEQGVVRELEATLLRRDGSEVVVEATSNIYSDESGFMLGLEGILRDIGRRKEAEQEAARERMFTDAVMESVPGLLYIYDSQERMVRWNRNYETMTGYSPEELLGSDAAAWFGGREPDTSIILASFRQAMAQGRSEAEALLFTKSGRRVPCLFTVARHTIDRRAYLVGMGMDITERKKSEELLLQSEKKFAHLFRNSPDAILLADIETGIVSDINDTFVAMTGYTRGEVIGRTTGSLNFYVDPALWDRLYGMLRREGHLANQELMIRTRDGHALVCALSSHVLQIGEQRVVMSVYRNVTELKKMQEMMIQTEKMVSIGGIAAGIAHEINNPLGIIMQSAQLLEQRTLPDFPRNVAVAEGMGLDLRLLDRYMRERNILGYVRDIREAAKRAADIIRHMLDFSRRSDSGHKFCCVNDIIDRAIVLAGSDYDLRKSFDFRRIQIVRDFEERMPGIRCSETEIEQVILNLLRNAAQALAGGSVAEPAITVRTRCQGENVVIEVEDNGPGIPPETVRRIFEPFFTTKPPGQGTGLGLSVSYFIVTQTHGGSIHVRSAPEQGACFHIEIPRASPAGKNGRS